MVRPTSSWAAATTAGGRPSGIEPVCVTSGADRADDGGLPDMHPVSNGAQVRTASAAARPRG